jgi:predicted transcriptional regulator of viral defense system
MSKTITGLSTEEASFLAQFAGEGKEIFTVTDAYAYWDDDPNTPFRLRDLEEKGWLERLERGKYLIVPLEAGLAREWTENAFVIAAHLVQPAAVAYWSALHHWNLTEQVPRLTYVQTTSRKFRRRKEVLGLRFRFITVTPRKFFGLNRETLDHKRYQVTDREKTLIDCLDRLDLAGGIAEVLGALRAGLDEFDWSRLDNYLGRFRSGAVIKRLGFLIEAMELAIPDREPRLAAWARNLTAGLAMLDPSSGQTNHRIATRWNLRVNVDNAMLAAGK